MRDVAELNSQAWDDMDPVLSMKTQIQNSRDGSL